MSVLLKVLLGAGAGSFPETPSPDRHPLGDSGDAGDGVSEKFSRTAAKGHALLPLRRCGALVCHECRVHGASPHAPHCAVRHFDTCGSRWFWRSPYGAIKCVACAPPFDLALVLAWVLARETGEGEDGWDIPSEIFSLLGTRCDAWWKEPST